MGRAGIRAGRCAPRTAGMDITDAAFDALVADLQAALVKFQVPEREQQELLAMLAPMRVDIVNYP